jgi:acetyl-CoA carboxylase biotin carboxyl carrier protein
MRESVIKRLIKLVEESSIEELEVSRWGRKVRISKVARASPAVNSNAAAPSAVSVEGAPPAHKVETPGPAAAEVEEAEADNLLEITSPMVGTFYRTSAPGSEPFVKVGQVVEKGTVVCIVEAMKLMNEIESEVSGRIARVMVEDAQPVEFGQSLFLVEPS